MSSILPDLRVGQPLALRGFMTKSLICIRCGRGDVYTRKDGSRRCRKCGYVMRPSKAIGKMVDKNRKRMEVRYYGE